jgi:hypothetical protein
LLERAIRRIANAQRFQKTERWKGKLDLRWCAGSKRPGNCRLGENQLWLGRDSLLNLL